MSKENTKSTMKLTSIFFLIGFYALCVELPLSCHAKVPRPDKVQPGVCPHTSGTCNGEKVVDYCQGDDQCPNQRKCCLGPCGKACAQPEKVKPGACPPQYVQCRMVAPDLCEKDESCPGRERCCEGFCGKECRLPEQEKPKSCPLDATQCTKLADYECNNDSECKGTAKCCFSKCALRCMTLL